MKNVSTALVFALALGLCAAAPGASAQIHATLTPYGTKTEITWSEPSDFRADVFYSGPPCPAPGLLPAMEGNITLRVNGKATQTRAFYRSFGRECSNAQWSAQADFLMTNLFGFGTHVLVADYSGSSTLPPVSTAPITIRVNPPFSFALPGSVGVLKAGIADPNDLEMSCRVRNLVMRDRAQLLSPPPAILHFPYGYVDFHASDCSAGMSSGPRPIRQILLMELPAEIPPGAELWAFERSKDGASAHWKRIDASILGREVRAELDGGGPSIFGPDQRIDATLALAVPEPRTTLELVSLTPTELRWGEPMRLLVNINVPCSVSFPNQVTLRTDAGVGITAAFIPPPPPTCPPSGVITAQVPFEEYLITTLPPGAHFLQVTTTIGAARIASPMVLIRLNPQFTLPGPIEPLSVGIARDPSLSTCSHQHARRYDRETAPVPMPPPNMRTPHELVTIEASGCVPGPASLRGGASSQLIALEIPRGLPPGAVVWVHDSFKGGWRPVAQEDCASFATCLEPVMRARGEYAIFTVYGTASHVSATMAVALPQSFARNFDLEDLWWGGSRESGWGISIAKNDERLFATLFAYDASGRPQWLVLQDAVWDSVHEVYHGNLYRPAGAPFNNYDGTRFKMGEAVGTGSLSFTGPDDGHFDYTIDGYSGGKALERFVYAPRNYVPSPRAGMWWGGAGQEGWGLSIQEQGEVMFATWYTYTSNGTVTWFYMPAGRKSGAATYVGEVYRTTGPAWVGAYFDGSKTRASAVGTMELSFKDADHATMTSTVDGQAQSRPLLRFKF